MPPRLLVDDFQLKLVGAQSAQRFISPALDVFIRQCLMRIDDYCYHCENDMSHQFWNIAWIPSEVSQSKSENNSHSLHVIFISLFSLQNEFNPVIQFDDFSHLVCHVVTMNLTSSSELYPRDGEFNGKNKYPNQLLPNYIHYSVCASPNNNRSYGRSLTDDKMGNCSPEFPRAIENYYFTCWRSVSTLESVCLSTLDWQYSKDNEQQ